MSRHTGTDAMSASQIAASTRRSRFDAAFAALPLVAILRGVKPEEAEGIAVALYNAGFRIIEVPLNSPEPLKSIAAMRAVLPQDAIVGAGTVMRESDVDALAAIGADLVVMPHADTTIVSASVRAGLVCAPGVMTPTEAFAALDAGAAALKLFPAELITPAAVRALMAVMPPGTRLLPVGGITPVTMKPYLAAGAAGFGIGSAVYKPGLQAAEVGARAAAFIAAWQARGE